MSDDDNNFRLLSPSHHTAQPLPTVQQQGKYQSHAKAQGQLLPLPAFQAIPALITTN
jgi:hypothetical protein